MIVMSLFINNVNPSFIKLKLLISIFFISNYLLADYTTEVTPVWDAFGGALILGDGHLRLPNGAQAWAGFGGMNTGTSDGFPYTFTSGGQVKLSANHPTGGTVKIKLRFEKAPHPDVDPIFETEEIEISGSNASDYFIEISSKGSNTYSNLIVYVIDDGNDALEDEVIINNIFITQYGVDPPNTVDPELPPDYSNYYTPSNVASFGSSTFNFGQNTQTGENITWQQEITSWSNPTHNQEIQQYKSGYVGKDSNENLVLEVKRISNSTFYSSRVNTQIYDGIKVGLGEKLSVEFEAQLPVAKDINGNYVPNVPLWPALWLMGNDEINGNWIGWPFCAEIDVMEWSPTVSETQANIAYHWHGTNKHSNEIPNYSHWWNANYYTDSDIHTKFHKWRVDIYRYDDGTTNKIEMFLDDVYINGSRRFESTSDLNQEYWAPTTSKHPTQTFGSGDKEYFLIMNIALGGSYTGIINNELIPSSFDHAEMVIKNVTYEISSLNTFELNLNYDTNLVSVTKTPDLTEYPRGTDVIITAIPIHGLLLAPESGFSNNQKTITMNQDEDETISVRADEDGDDDGDGVNNYLESIVHNSNSNSTDSDNDNSSDYFEFIAGTSLTDASDYFYVQSSVDLSGAFNLEFNSKSNRNYSIKVSDNLSDWHLWRMDEGNGEILSRIFDPNSANISGLNNNSDRFFFIVDIEKQN